jgi:hypothetical protein
MKETRIFASPSDMVEQTKEERLQWAEGNGSVMSLNQFLSYINRGIIEENKNYQYDSYETSDDTYETSDSIIVPIYYDVDEMTKKTKTPLFLQTNETINVPIYYYIDEEENKIYDIEEMTKEFETKLYQLEGK